MKCNWETIIIIIIIVIVDSSDFMEYIWRSMKAVFPKRRKENSTTRSSIVSYTFLFFYFFFFSNITKLVTATRKTGRGKKHRKKEKKKYQHDISSTMNYRCTQVVKTRGNPVSVDRRNTVRSLDKWKRFSHWLLSFVLGGQPVSPGLTAGFKSGNHFYAVKRGEIGAAVPWLATVTDWS